MRPAELICYRLMYYQDYDPESVWSLVQRHQGYVSIEPAGQYVFWIPRDYSVLLLLAFPGLIRAESRDYFL